MIALLPIRGALFMLPHRFLARGIVCTFLDLDTDSPGLWVRLDLYLWLYDRFCQQSSHVLTLHVLLDGRKY
jgi:hypothetical protein